VIEFYGKDIDRDADTLRRGLNFTLTTALGPLDLLGAISGGGAYQDLERRVSLLGGAAGKLRPAA
jgi:hypothetical protein